MNDRFVFWLRCVMVLAVLAMIFMAGCRDDSDSDNYALQALQAEEVVIPETTKVLDESTMQNLSSLSADTTTRTLTGPISSGNCR